MKLNQALLIAALLASSTLALFAPQTAQAKTPERRTYALIVANNGSVDQGVQPLRYADDDGARYYELFSHLADDTTLLTVLDADSQRVFPKLASRSLPPSKAQLKRSVATLAAQIKADRKKGIETELYLVFTGHGNVEERSGEGYLSLLDGKLRRSDLYREVLRPLEANYTHLIIDACHAYFMVQSRGGKDGAAWQDDRTGQTHDQELAAYFQHRPQGDESVSSTLGVLLSTSGAAEVHEWSKFRAGVFSHELRSGLLGGADANADGRITYTELEAYLAAANAGVTNPKARINVWASAPKQDRDRPLVRTADYRQASRLKLPSGQAGRYYIEDARGLRYADVHSAPEGQASIVLLREPVDRRDYFLRTDDALASVSLKEDSINGAALAFAPQADQARSSVEASFRANLFSTPYGPGFYAGFMAARDQRPELELNAPALPAAQTRSPWSMRLGLSYGLSAPLLDLGGLQQDLTLNLPFLHDQGWVLGPYLSYGTSGHTSEGADSLSGITQGDDYRLHRISGGLEAGFETTQLTGSSLRLGLIGRAGYQGIFLSAGSLSADPLGLRAEALLRAAWAQPGWSIIPTLQAGWSVNLVRRASSVEGQTFVYQSPTVQLGLEF